MASKQRVIQRVAGWATLLGVGGALLLVGANPAAAVTPVGFGAVITAPGVYILNGNQSGSGDGITINADHVTLLLGGFTLSKPGFNNFAGTEVHPNATGVSIRGPGVVTGFLEGIHFGHGAEGNTIAGVHANGNFTGIAFGPNARNNRLMNNQANNNGIGIQFFPNAANNHLIRNQANGNIHFGIRLAGAGHTGNLVQLNTANGNGVGIQVDSVSSGNTFQLNQALDNLVLDLEDRNVPAAGNTWRRNEFVTDNEGDGPGAGVIQ